MACDGPLYAARAQRSLHDSQFYLDERSPRGATNVKLAIKRAVETIGENPSIGRPTSKGEIRGLPIGSYPYLVYWAVESDEVRILHIAMARAEFGAADLGAPGLSRLGFPRMPGPHFSRRIR
jgi:plasmid stabilization system protein ParE